MSSKNRRILFSFRIYEISTISLDESNARYSTDAVNFIIEVYCPWNFHHDGVNHHFSPASFPDYLAIVSKSNHLKLIKYNLQRRWYLDGCYTIYLIILRKLIVYIYIHRRTRWIFLKLKLIWNTLRYYEKGKYLKKILSKVVPLPFAYTRLKEISSALDQRLNLRVWYFKSIYCHVLTKVSVTRSKDRQASFVKVCREALYYTEVFSLISLIKIQEKYVF